MHRSCSSLGHLSHLDAFYSILAETQASCFPLSGKNTGKEKAQQSSFETFQKSGDRLRRPGHEELSSNPHEQCEESGMVVRM